VQQFLKKRGLKIASDMTKHEWAEAHAETMRKLDELTAEAKGMN
jgi:hypothetical protein